MTSAQTQKFLERLIEAGEDGLENRSIEHAEEHELVRELVHDGEASIRIPIRIENGQEVEGEERFVVAEYGTYERLYILRGWVRSTRDGLLLTEQGRLHLRFAPLEDEQEEDSSAHS